MTAGLYRLTENVPLDRWSGAMIAVGLGLAGFHVFHIFEMMYYGTVAVVLEGVIPLLLSGALIATVPLLHQHGCDRFERRLVFKWMVAVGALVGLLFVWALSHQMIMNEPFPHAVFVTMTNVTAGALLGIVLGMYNVTLRRHRKAIEDERETITNQRARLSVLNRVLRHNLRNDATVVLGHTNEITNNANGEIAKHAAIASKKTADLVELSDKARQIDKTIAYDGSFDDEVHPVEVVKGLIDGDERFDTGVDVEIDAPTDLEPIRTSKAVLTQVISELLENAGKHVPADRRCIHIDVIEDAESEWIEIVIADNGPGVPVLEQRGLEAGHETDLEHASGLGLWLVKWGVEAIGGELFLDESHMGGASFHVRLPREGESENRVPLVDSIPTG